MRGWCAAGLDARCALGTLGVAQEEGVFRQGRDPVSRECAPVAEYTVHGTGWAPGPYSLETESATRGANHARSEPGAAAVASAVGMLVGGEGPQAEVSSIL